MQLLISNEQQEAAVDEKLCSLIQDALEAVLALEGNGKRETGKEGILEVSLTLVDDARMAALNLQYRGIAGTTDVLSFPMNEQEVGTEEIGSADAGKSPASNLSPLTSQMELLLGDIVISVPRALSQAKDYGNSFTQEMVFLAVHGMLHLLGYDDETDQGAARMMERARRVMDKLGLGADEDA